MANLSKSKYQNFTCKRCNKFFGLNVSTKPTQARVKSKYKNICINCLKPREMTDLSEIMNINED